MKITKPGIYPDLADADYRAQVDWLSVSGAKKLLPPSCPAKFKATIGEEEHKPQYDLGKAFHAAVLGDGPAVEVHRHRDRSHRGAPAPQGLCCLQHERLCGAGLGSFQAEALLEHTYPQASCLAGRTWA